MKLVSTPCPRTLSPHFVSTPCLHTLSSHFVSTLCPFTLRLHTLSLRFVESERASECSSPVRFRCALEPAVSAVLRKLPPALDPRQPPATPSTPSGACKRQHRHCILHTAYCILHTAYCILPLSPLPAPLCLRERFLLTPLPTATAYCHSPVSCLLSPVSACTEAPRPPRRHKLTVQHPKGRAGRPRHAATRRDRRAANREKAPTARPIPA